MNSPMDDLDLPRKAALDGLRQAILQLNKDDTSDEASRSLRSATGKLLQVAAEGRQTPSSESPNVVPSGDATEWHRAASKLVEDELKWLKGKSNSSAPKAEKFHGNLYAEFLKLNRKLLGTESHPTATSKHPDFGTSSRTQQLIKEKLGIGSGAQLRQCADHSLEMRLRNDTKAAEEDRFDSWTRPARWGFQRSWPPLPEAGNFAAPTKTKTRSRGLRKQPMVDYGSTDNSSPAESEDELERGLHEPNNTYKPMKQCPNFLVNDLDAQAEEERAQKSYSPNSESDGDTGDGNGSSEESVEWTKDDEDLDMDECDEDMASIEHPEGTEWAGDEPDDEEDVDTYNDDGKDSGSDASSVSA